MSNRMKAQSIKNFQLPVLIKRHDSEAEVWVVVKKKMHMKFVFHSTWEIGNAKLLK